MEGGRNLTGYKEGPWWRFLAWPLRIASRQSCRTCGQTFKCAPGHKLDSYVPPEGDTMMDDSIGFCDTCCARYGTAFGALRHTCGPFTEFVSLPASEQEQIVTEAIHA